MLKRFTSVLSAGCSARQIEKGTGAGEPWEAPRKARHEAAQAAAGDRLQRKHDAPKEPDKGDKADVVNVGQHQAITLESRIESVDEAEAVAERVAANAGFDEDERHRIAMAVREITVNAVMHGNGYDRSKKVVIEFELLPRELVVSIIDQGNGFDLGRVSDPLAPDNLLRQSGRGIFLARAFMDKVDVKPSHSGTSVRLVKHRQTSPPAPPQSGRS